MIFFQLYFLRLSREFTTKFFQATLFSIEHYDDTFPSSDNDKNAYLKMLQWNARLGNEMIQKILDESAIVLSEETKNGFITTKINDCIFCYICLNHLYH